MNCIVELSVVYKGGVYLLQEVVTENFGESNPNIRYPIIYEGQEVKLEMLLKYILLHHYASTHQYVQLTLLECSCLEISGINYAYNSFLLLRQVVKLFYDVRHGGARIRSNFCYTISQELKKHWQELRVNSLTIKKFGVVAKILCKDQLDSPLLLACLLEGLDDVLNEYLSFLQGHLLQKDVQVPKGAKFDVHYFILQESFHAWQQVSLGMRRPQYFCQLMN